MKNKNYACPRCSYPLVPVHAIEGSKRRVIALTCPEPYCDHMQMVPRDHSSGFSASSRSTEGSDPQRAAR